MSTKTGEPPLNNRARAQGIACERERGREKEKPENHNENAIACRVRHLPFITDPILASFANKRVVARTNAHLHATISCSLTRIAFCWYAPYTPFLICAGQWRCWMLIHVNSQHSCVLAPCKFSSDTWNLDKNLFRTGANLMYRSITMSTKKKETNEWTKGKKTTFLTKCFINRFVYKMLSIYFERTDSVCVNECVAIWSTEIQTVSSSQQSAAKSNSKQIVNKTQRSEKR